MNNNPPNGPYICIPGAVPVYIELNNSFDLVEYNSPHAVPSGYINKIVRKRTNKIAVFTKTEESKDERFSSVQLTGVECLMDIEGPYLI